MRKLRPRAITKSPVLTQLVNGTDRIQTQTIFFFSELLQHCLTLKTPEITRYGLWHEICHSDIDTPQQIVKVKKNICKNLK